MADPKPVELVETYLDCLENEEFERAADLFTEDGVYIHPPIFSDSPKIEGRENILEYFLETRGTRDVDHETTGTVVEGNKATILGTSTGDDIDGVHYYISYVETEGDKISYYCVSYRPAE